MGSGTKGEAKTGTGGGAASVRRLSSGYDKIASIALIVLWLLPLLWVGGLKKNVPLATTWMQHQYRAACLFTESLTRWNTYHVEVQRKGSDRWEELDLRGYFDMTVFGYRSRLHRILGQTYKKSKGKERMAAIAEFIRTRWNEYHPTGPELDAMRFVRITRYVKELGKEQGHFETKTLADFPKSRWLIFGEHRWDGKKPRHANWGRMAVDPKKKKDGAKGAKDAPAPKDGKAPPPAKAPPDAPADTPAEDKAPPVPAEEGAPEKAGAEGGE